MYTSQFSEFSYGYALTDNILHGGLPATASAPVFPSLIDEGSSGGGYDVQIPLYPVPIFLQFKIPQVVGRRSRKMPAGFTKPYLRMHLRTKIPNQHQLLLDLETSGKLVAYATPDFWETNQLDSYFTARAVPLRTRYFRPSGIGPLDDKPHQVAYYTGIPDAWLYSEPHKLEGTFDAETFGKEISTAVRRARRQDPLNFLNRLSAMIADLSRSRRPRDFRDERAAQAPQPTDDGGRQESLEIAQAAREAAYLAQVRLGCTLVITGRNE